MDSWSVAVVGQTLQVTPVVTELWANNPNYVITYNVIVSRVSTGDVITVASNAVDADNFSVRHLYYFVNENTFCTNKLLNS